MVASALFATKIVQLNFSLDKRLACLIYFFLFALQQCVRAVLSNMEYGGRMNNYIMNIGSYAVKLKQSHPSVHLPSAVGLSAATHFEQFCNAESFKDIRNQYKFDKNRIKSVCDIGTGAGHLSILCGIMLNNVSDVTCTDISEHANNTAEYNWKMNGMNKGIAFRTITGDVSDVLDYFVKRNQKFDLIVCNPPNLGIESGSEDTFNITDDEGRYVLDTVLTKGFKCLNDGGYIYTTDTTLNYSFKTDQYLENILHLTKDKDWFEIKRVEMNIPFLEDYGDKSNINEQWIENMISTERILVNENDGLYYQIRRYLLIRKPIRNKSKL